MRDANVLRMPWEQARPRSLKRWRDAGGTRPVRGQQRARHRHCTTPAFPFCPSCRFSHESLTFRLAAPQAGKKKEGGSGDAGETEVSREFEVMHEQISRLSAQLLKQLYNMKNTYEMLSLNVSEMNRRGQCARPLPAAAELRGSGELRTFHCEATRHSGAPAFGGLLAGRLR